jgi:predicted dehydrogenase
MLRIGLIGLGGMGRTHARHYKNVPDCRLVAAHDIDAERTTSFCKEFELAPKSSIEALIASVDAVDICTPTPTHCVIALESLRAGKPTICEKPMCRTVEQCKRLVDEVAARDLIFMPAHVVRFFPEFATAHRLVRHGTVGRPAAIRTRRGGAFPNSPGNWFADFAQSGGVLLDLIIHDFDWIRWTFGEVERVYAKGLIDSGIPGMDYALVTLKMTSGAVAHVEGTWADPGGFRVTLEVAGDGGFFEFDSLKVGSLVTTKADGGRQRESPLLPTDDPYRLELAHFVDRVHSGRQTDITATDGMKAVAISEAAIESVRTGKPVTLGGQR